MTFSFESHLELISLAEMARFCVMAVLKIPPRPPRLARMAGGPTPLFKKGGRGTGTLRFPPLPSRDCVAIRHPGSPTVSGYPGSSSGGFASLNPPYRLHAWAAQDVGWIKAFGRIHQKLCRICLTHLNEVSSTD